MSRICRRTSGDMREAGPTKNESGRSSGRSMQMMKHDFELTV